MSQQKIDEENGSTSIAEVAKNIDGLWDDAKSAACVYGGIAGGLWGQLTGGSPVNVNDVEGYCQGRYLSGSTE